MKFLKFYENFDFFLNLEILKSGERNADDNYRMGLVRHNLIGRHNLNLGFGWSVGKPEYTSREVYSL